MAADGSDVQRLTNSAGSDFGSTWSPGGSHIAFGSNRNGDTEVFVMDQFGNAQTNLTNSPSSFDGHPDWCTNPLVPKIAFYSNRDGNNEIYVMNTDGTYQTRLTNNAANDHSPVV